MTDRAAARVSSKRVAPMPLADDAGVKVGKTVQDDSDCESVDSVEMGSTPTLPVPAAVPIQPAKFQRKQPTGPPRRVIWSDAAGKKLCEVSMHMVETVSVPCATVQSPDWKVTNMVQRVCRIGGSSSTVTYNVWV